MNNEQIGFYLKYEIVLCIDGKWRAIISTPFEEEVFELPDLKKYS